MSEQRSDLLSSYLGNEDYMTARLRNEPTRSRFSELVKSNIRLRPTLEKRVDMTSLGPFAVTTTCHDGKTLSHMLW
jgi:hypothetical protein